MTKTALQLLSERCANVGKKFKLFWVLGSAALLLAFYACRIVLPSPKDPLLFYSNQTRHNIHSTFSKAIAKAQESVYLSFYGISDAKMISLLGKKEKEGLALRIEYDPSASSLLKNQLQSALPIKTKGLMHRKIAVLDHSTVFLGSANFTTTSLNHHANLILGFYHPPLAHYLERPFSNEFQFKTGATEGHLFLLPDPSRKSFFHLLSSIEKASDSIQVAMFTLTHPTLVEALIAAKKRGVNVSVAIDYYTARGASKKSVDKLLKEGINCYYSQGKELLHYKWALIDGSCFIMGSANWTTAAFNRNQDFLLFLNPLSSKHKQFIDKLWDIIITEAQKK